MSDQKSSQPTNEVCPKCRETAVVDVPCPHVQLLETPTLSIPAVTPSQAERGYRSRHLREGPQPTYGELTRWYTQTVAALTQLEAERNCQRDLAKLYMEYTQKNGDRAVEFQEKYAAMRTQRDTAYGLLRRIANRAATDVEIYQMQREARALLSPEEHQEEKHEEEH